MIKSLADPSPPQLHWWKEEKEINSQFIHSFSYTPQKSQKWCPTKILSVKEVWERKGGIAWIGNFRISVSKYFQKRFRKNLEQTLNEKGKVNGEEEKQQEQKHDDDQLGDKNKNNSRKHDGRRNSLSQFLFGAADGGEKMEISRKMSEEGE